jgi:hypothetical protein
LILKPLIEALNFDLVYPLVQTILLGKNKIFKKRMDCVWEGGREGGGGLDGYYKYFFCVFAVLAQIINLLWMPEF